MPVLVSVVHLFICYWQTTTVQVYGPYKFQVTSYNPSVKFTNVRFQIGSGADFSLSLANDGDLGTATFTGVTALVCVQYLDFTGVCSVYELV